MTIRTQNDRIQTLYLVTNPEKLTHLPELEEPEGGD